MKMACVLQIGAGGVGGVVAHKMAMNRAVFSRIILASRTLTKCQAIADSVCSRGLGEIEIDIVDADNVESVVALIEKYHPFLVINVALPYQDLSIMEACLRTKTHYLDTANYEHPDSAHFEYKEQWAYDTRYKRAGIFALLGSGFDPGVTNVFCAYAQKHYFDEIHSIDILDCNDGDHGYAFATNFNPEINLREVSSKARYWVRDDFNKNFAESSEKIQSTPHKNKESLDSKTSSLVSPHDLLLNPDLKQDRIYRKFEREEQHWRAEVEKNEAESKSASNLGGDSKTLSKREEQSQGSLEGSDFSSLSQNAKLSYCGGQWRDIAPLALMKEWDYREVGVKNSYLLYHEELESLVRNIRGLQKIRFFMTFGESYLTHMKCLENIGLLRIDEVSHKGGKIVPLEVLKTLLPDPASLAHRTKGQTHIGCYIKGRKDGKERTIYIYNICDHESCFKEVNAQGVSYTTGVPAMIGAKLICEGKWGVGAIKNSSLTQNTRILDSKVVDSSIESYNTTRLEANKDMPRGGEYQGIDNGAKLYKGVANESAEISFGNFSSCQARNEGITKAVMTEIEGEDSAKIIKETTQRDSKILSEKCGLRSHECGDKANASITQTNDKLPHLSSKAEFQGSGVWNMEQNDPDPFMCELNKQGLPYIVCEIESSGKVKVLEDGRK